MVDRPRAGARIRILRVLSRLNVGGPSHHVIALTRDLRTFGFDTTLAVGEPHTCEGDMFADARRAGVNPHLIAGLDRPISLISDLQAFSGLLRLIRDLRPHIVHTHTTKAGVLGRLAAWLCRVPIIVHTFHGHVFTGYFSHLGSLGAVNLERVLATRTDRLITLSETLKIDLLKRLRSTKPNHIQVVPLGLPLEKLAASPRHTGRFRQSLGVDAKTCLWGIVARLVPVKNHALLLDTFARLARQHDTLHLAIVGGGELADSLRNRVRKLGLSHRVHFTGIFHPIEDVYADLDLLLLTSLNEGTPVVLMESLAAGCPAAATAVGGVADVFRDCGSGTLLPCDPEGLRRRLSVLVQSHSPAQSLSPEIRARVVERYSCTSLARRTAAVYAPLLAHRVPEYHQL